MNTRPDEPGEGLARAAEPAAPLGSWGRLYAVVIAALAFDIALLAWLTRRFP